jgi:hypothetical protein
MIDFEAFGQKIDADVSKTPWPPTGPSMTRPQSPAVLMKQSMASGEGNTQNLNTNTAGGMNFLEPDFGWGMGMGMGMGMNMGVENQVEDDGFGWLSGLGAGDGFFGTDNANANGDGNAGDLGFTQDPFWLVFPCFEFVLADDQEIDTGTCSRTAMTWSARYLASSTVCITIITRCLCSSTSPVTYSASRGQVGALSLT